MRRGSRRIREYADDDRRWVRHLCDRFGPRACEADARTRTGDLLITKYPLALLKSAATVPRRAFFFSTPVT
jgi:hypothetical protein